MDKAARDELATGLELPLLRFHGQQFHINQLVVIEINLYLSLPVGGTVSTDTYLM